jgi:hypothetical protein
MVMKMRQPNRRGFRSPIREARRREREYYYAAVSVLVVKIVLLFFLCMLFYVSLKLFPYKFPDGSFLAKYGVPLLVAMFALILLRFIFKNIKEIRASSKARKKGD